ncbi:hypothetical protein JAAARDRAFT_301270 [Jaapia argillacea MUCL 33604]|uniref:Uncharacterized protein n=1 Tax=Jaapia argillacea MUCL 33604 TaxID=933084 RepID=A0A067PPS3_9AGAM|nr:hypothetical protein JAAARDRAFT_301270 [Jaapia argillacea MUCL 33604]
MADPVPMTKHQFVRLLNHTRQRRQALAGIPWEEHIPPASPRRVASHLPSPTRPTRSESTSVVAIPRVPVAVDQLRTLGGAEALESLVRSWSSTTEAVLAKEKCWLGLVDVLRLQNCKVLCQPIVHQHLLLVIMAQMSKASEPVQQIMHRHLSEIDPPTDSLEAMASSDQLRDQLLKTMLASMTINTVELPSHLMTLGLSGPCRHSLHLPTIPAM